MPDIIKSGLRGRPLPVERGVTVGISLLLIHWGVWFFAVVVVVGFGFFGFFVFLYLKATHYSTLGLV